MDINWDEVTHPFLPDRRNQKWITHGTVDMTENEDGTYTVTNETVKVSATAPSMEEAMSKLNAEVQKEIQSGKAFIGRSY